MKAPSRTEELRRQEVQRLAVLDTDAEPCYDEITRMAASACNASMAVIALLDEERQWFKSRVGLAIEQTPLKYAFHAQALEIEGPLIVEDASKDRRFAQNPFVTGAPHIRFYASAKLVTLTGTVVGTLCVMDPVPHKISQYQIDQLQFAAQQIVYMLEMGAN